MKRLTVLCTILLMLLFGLTLAQQPPIEEYYAMGNVYTATALDTLHSTFTKDSGVATAKWYGPRVIQIPKTLTDDPASRNGAWESIKAMPSGYFMYAEEPFTFKALYVNGDSTGLATVLVDTTTVTAGVGGAGSGFKATFPCQYHLKGAVSQLRMVPSASDSVMTVPLYLPLGGYD